MPLRCLFKEHERTKPELRVWNKDEDPSSYELSSAGREFNSKSVMIFGNLECCIPDVLEDFFIYSFAE